MITNTEYVDSLYNTIIENRLLIYTYDFIQDFDWHNHNIELYNQNTILKYKELLVTKSNDNDYVYSYPIKLSYSYHQLQLFALYHGHVQLEKLNEDTGKWEVLKTTNFEVKQQLSLRMLINPGTYLYKLFLVSYDPEA